MTENSTSYRTCYECRICEVLEIIMYFLFVASMFIFRVQIVTAAFFVVFILVQCSTRTTEAWTEAEREGGEVKEISGGSEKTSASLGQGKEATSFREVISSSE